MDALSILSQKNPAAPVPAEPSSLTQTHLPAAVQHFLHSSAEAERAFNALRVRVEELKIELDQTNRQLREKVQELDYLSGHLVALLESLADGVVAVDQMGIIRVFNAPIERLSGHPAHQMIGRPLSEWLTPDGVPRRLVEESLQGFAPQRRVRTLLPKSDGQTCPVAAAACPVKDKSGQTLGAVLILQDMAEIAELQQQMQRTASLAELGRMASVVAHEIRNPLGGIEGFAQLLQSDLAGQPERRRYVDLMLEGLQDLHRFVDSLLTFSRYPSLRLEEVDLCQILKELIELVLQDRQLHKGQFRHQFQGPASACLLADRSALRQVFLNLIRNGLEALDGRKDGEIRIRISPTLLEGAEAFQIDVADTGPGIAPEARAKLFQPFMTTKRHGTGLGLPTAAKLVEAHGGHIGCVAEPDGGACFRIVLPLSAAGCLAEESHADRTRTGR
jgi:PAS domain S-box-containing protein